MSYRNIMITNPAKISIKNEQLIIETDEKHSVPIEDITSVILENRQVNISVYALSLLSENGVCVFVCDEKHLPSGILLPFNNHCREYAVLKAQTELSKPSQKQIWKQVVEKKILNQAKVLEENKKQEAERLINISKHIRSGDPENLEGTAAAIYFKALFGTGFSRSQENSINAALNYGYAIMRGCVARNIAAAGLQPSFGIHHCSEVNQFNLADDLMEPFRPIVDLFVSENINEEESFGKSERVKLYNLLNCDVVLDGKNYTVAYAVEKMVQSFAACCKKTKAELSLPEIILLKQHEYE